MSILEPTPAEPTVTDPGPEDAARGQPQQPTAHTPSQQPTPQQPTPHQPPPLALDPTPAAESDPGPAACAEAPADPPAVLTEPAKDEPAQDGAVQDRAVQDGAVQDGAVQDGAVQDGPAEDGAVPDEAAQESARDGGGRPKSKPSKRAKPSWPPPPKERLDGALEALLLTVGDVVRMDRIRDLLGLPSRTVVEEALERIQARWRAAGLAVELEQVARGVRVVTRPEYAEYVGRLKRRPTSDKLTRTLLETLSIVAYKQPVGRAEVERIRGVQAGEALRGLLERNLLRVVGRSDQPGRPLLYGTTDRFLTVFGLRDLKDLPTQDELKRM